MYGELKKIKKKYGEDMAHFCRDNFSSILETNGLLFEILSKSFEPTTRLYEDLFNNDLLDEFSSFIYSQIEPPKEEIKTDKDPFVLMREAGYTLYECKSEKDIQRFKKLYYPGEELCTFHGHRLDKCHVFFAVKDGAQELNRNDFINPERQDEYGTSVISIQFTKTNCNMVSIKNRYNHTVSNPDATFSNNLDNIIPGLRYSFNAYYDFNIPNFAHNLEIPGYVLAENGKYYHYNYEFDAKYYCSNNIIIDDYEPKYFNPSKYLLIDTYLLDLEKKRIDSEYSTIGLKTALGDIKKISIEKEKDAKVITIKNSRGNVNITVDLDNLIIGYEDDNIEVLPNNFLMYNESLEWFSGKSVIGIGDNVLRLNAVLQELYVPRCVSIGDNFLKQNILLPEVSFPSLIKVGTNFLQKNTEIICGYFPNLCSVKAGFLESLNNKERLFMPELSDDLIFPSEDEYVLTLIKK